MIHLTEEAGEKVKAVLADRGKDPSATGLRIFVQPGGCSGFSYGLTLESNPTEDDRVYEQHGVRIIVDPTSAMYLNGSQIDYVESLTGGGFAIRNPNAQQTCGCGQSFRTSTASGKPQPCDDDGNRTENDGSRGNRRED